MAICDWCKQDMLKVKSCPANTEVEFPTGEVLPAIPFEGPGRCHDCYVVAGAFHHPGCDMEVCPKCGGQLISCDCLDDGEDEDDEWETDEWGDDDWEADE